jgi:hypothetical protein
VKENSKKGQHEFEMVWNFIDGLKMCKPSSASKRIGKVLPIIILRIAVH